MKHAYFHIGLEFIASAGFRWRCTDVGTRTILAKRTGEIETKAANIECLGRNIRNPQVQVPPSLAVTCQLRPVSWKAERNTYIGSKADVSMLLAQHQLMGAAFKTSRLRNKS